MSKYFGNTQLCAWFTMGRMTVKGIFAWYLFFESIFNMKLFSENKILILVVDYLNFGFDQPNR
jgi:hypothetical protein